MVIEQIDMSEVKDMLNSRVIKHTTALTKSCGDMFGTKLYEIANNEAQEWIEQHKNLSPSDLYVLWEKRLSCHSDKISSVHKVFPVLKEIAIEMCTYYGNHYNINYNYGDLTSELYILAMSRLARKWFLPQDNIEGIKKAWRAYLRDSFRSVLKTESKSGVIPTHMRNGEYFSPMKDFSDGLPDWISFENPSSDNGYINDMLQLFKNVLSPNEYTILIMRTGIYFPIMKYQHISDCLSEIDNKEYTKGYIHYVYKTACKKCVKYL